MNAPAAKAATGVALPETQGRRSKAETHSDIVRPYSQEEVERLRGTVKIEYALARLGAERLPTRKPGLAVHSTSSNWLRQ